MIYGQYECSREREREANPSLQIFLKLIILINADNTLSSPHPPPNIQSRSLKFFLQILRLMTRVRRRSLELPRTGWHQEGRSTPDWPEP